MRSAFTILFILLILILLVTYTIPVGSNEYNADGLVNLVTSTSAVIMGGLASARASYGA